MHSEHPNTPEVLCTFKIRGFSDCKLNQGMFCIQLKMDQSSHNVESQSSVLCCHQPTAPLKRTSFHPGSFLVQHLFNGCLNCDKFDTVLSGFLRTAFLTFRTHRCIYAPRASQEPLSPRDGVVSQVTTTIPACALPVWPRKICRARAKKRQTNCLPLCTTISL